MRALSLAGASARIVDLGWSLIGAVEAIGGSPTGLKVCVVSARVFFVSELLGTKR